MSAIKILSFISATRRFLLHGDKQIFIKLSYNFQPKFNGLVLGLWLTLSQTYMKIGPILFEISWQQTDKQTNRGGYFIKEIPNGFLCLDTLIPTLGMLLDFRKAINTRLAARFFLTLFSSLATFSVFGSE